MLDKIRDSLIWSYVYLIPKFEDHYLVTHINEDGTYSYPYHVSELKEGEEFDGLTNVEAFTWFGKVLHLSVKEMIPKKDVVITFEEED